MSYTDPHEDQDDFAAMQTITGKDLPSFQRQATNRSNQVRPANSRPTGRPVIYLTDGGSRTLYAWTDDIADADGLGPFSYQWIRGTDTDIAGATDLRYLPVAADIGHTLKVRVSWTDRARYAESVTSAATRRPVNGDLKIDYQKGVPSPCG